MSADVVSWPQCLRSKQLKERLSTAKVLCVGAGGIGCELLKTLVCTGFKNIELIDLDTIEVSNLNRQFLFRKHHVGSPKANTAAEVIRSFAPDANIAPHHSNIKEQKFGVEFFQGFDIVLNGLDNLDARRHVNRLCLAAGVPLIESGTAGYLGQVTVHVKGETECFECDEKKDNKKSFPICTLRNTPDKPIHCIVWAKDLLFARLFGASDQVSDLDDGAKQEDGEKTTENSTENSDENSDGNHAAPEDPLFFSLRGPGHPEGEETPIQYAVRIFNHIYKTDIERLITMEELWEKRAPPKPLDIGALLPDPAQNLADPTSEIIFQSASRLLGLTNPSQMWSLEDNVRVFLQSIIMFLTTRKEEVGSCVFDKDDDLAVDFVTAASNLRSSCYSIPMQTLFDAKGMAGSIIHAIATTNAIISGLIVIEAVKLLADQKPSMRNTYLHTEPSSKRLLSTQKPEGPKSKCMVCGKTQLTLRINTKITTLGHFVSQVIKKRLSVSTPMLLCNNFLYEEGEGLEEDEVEANQKLLPRVLEELPGGGIRSSSIVNVQDQSQCFSVDVVVLHQETFDEETHPDGFILDGSMPEAQQEPAETTAQPSASETMVAPKPKALEVRETADGVLLVDTDDEQEPEDGCRKGKRKLEDWSQEEGGSSEAAAKKAKVTEQANVQDGDDDVVILD